MGRGLLYIYIYLYLYFPLYFRVTLAHLFFISCTQKVWPFLLPMFHEVLAGGSTWSENQLMVLTRNNYVEEAYITVLHIYYIHILKFNECIIRFDIVL